MIGAGRPSIIVRRRNSTYAAVKYMVFIITIALLFVASSLLPFATQPRAQAATSSTLNFQARLSSSSGQVVPDGNYHIEFKLYNTSSAGTALWTETRTTGNLVRVANGYLSVNLGSVTAFPTSINWDQEHWLTMNIGGTGGTAVWDGEMSPRLKLTAVPYAFRSGQADALTNGSSTLAASDLIQRTPVSPQEFNNILAGIRLNQTGTGGLLQLQGDGADVFTVSKAGSIFAKGSIDVDGATIDVGTLTQQGGLVLHDGSSNTGLLQTAALSANRTYILPDEGGTVCMQGSVNCGFLVSGTVFTQNGNSFGGLATLGTNDNFGLAFETNGTTKMTILADGSVGIGTTSITTNTKLDINGNLVVRGTNFDSAVVAPAANFNGAYLTIGDPLGDQIFTNGMGIKFHDLGTAHASIKYVSSANRIDFCSSGNTASLTCDPSAETLSLDLANRRVGIGTTTPGNKFSVNALTTASGLAQLAVGTGATGNKGLIVQGVAGQIENLFEAQNSSGTRMFAVNSNGDAILRNNNGFYFDALSGNQGYLVLNSSNQFDWRMGSGGIRILNNAGTATVVNLTNTGAVRFQNTSNSTAAFEVLNAAGASLFTIDSVNGAIVIGNGGSLRFTGTAGDPASPANGDMWYNTTQNAHRLRTPVGNIGNGGLLCANTTVPAAIANTTALTDFGTETRCTLPADSLAVGKIIRVTARGVYSAGGLTAPILNLYVRSGSTTLGDSGAISTNINANNWGFTVQFNMTVISTGASGTVEGQGSTMVKVSTTQSNVTDMPNAALIPIDTTLGQTLTLSAKWGTASTSNTITLRQVTYEVMN
jgi:hypothetical protein